MGGVGVFVGVGVGGARACVRWCVCAYVFVCVRAHASVCACTYVVVVGGGVCSRTINARTHAHTHTHTHTSLFKSVRPQLWSGTGSSSTNPPAGKQRVKMKAAQEEDVARQQYFTAWCQVVTVGHCGRTHLSLKRDR